MPDSVEEVPFISESGRGDVHKPTPEEIKEQSDKFIRRRRKPKKSKNEGTRKKSENKEQHEQFAIEVEGHFREVLEALEEKKRLKESGEPHEHIRPVLILGGGALRPYIGAFLEILKERGYTADMFQAIVGLSAGAADSPHYVADEPEKITRIHKLASIEGLFSEKKKLFGSEDEIPEEDARLVAPFLYTRNVAKVASGEIGTSGKRNLDVAAVMASETPLYVVVTNWETGETELINVQEQHAKHDNIFDLLVASAYFPTPNQTEPLTIQVDDQEKQVTDGTIANPLPIQHILEELDPTHLLILGNEPENGAGKINIAIRRLVLKLPKVISKKLGSGKKTQKAELKRVRERSHDDPPTAIVWPKPIGKDVEPLFSDSQTLQRAIKETKEALCDELDKITGDTKQSLDKAD